ncbi:MAG: dTDP-4-dehydrorhamnose reductase (EC [uncultured Sulfurovum sp.]|uniref:dTDP-4-dehydrorhamnose reductase n=1 Tax=uncultured Sulfurovum sp. TaxID=269237 RepID=A0A6S6U8S2_9BACT|nr:MAG: dTDP-4-dehydrorhamnose reductase (EC [uncultured Sulfurovum sp.]
MNNILVTGSKGQLGSELQELINQYSYNFFFTNRKTLDITNSKQVNQFIENNQIDVILNCAAYTSVDLAEENKKVANLVNHLAVKNLAKITKEKQIKLIHISTDYIFNGENFKPYSEIDPAMPKNTYGETKLNGENAIKAINPKHTIIIRTSWVYSSFGNNFVKTMLSLGKKQKDLKIIFDQVGTPTYAKDLAITILNIIPQLKNNNVEVYHYSNEGVVSWYDFAKKIMEIENINCHISPIETSEYFTVAQRPYYSVLNKNKKKKHLIFKFLIGKIV